MNGSSFLSFIGPSTHFNSFCFISFSLLVDTFVYSAIVMSVSGFVFSVHHEIRSVDYDSNKTLSQVFLASSHDKPRDT